MKLKLRKDPVFVNGMKVIKKYLDKLSDDVSNNKFPPQMKGTETTEYLLKMSDAVIVVNTSIKYKPKMSQETSRIIYGG